MPPKAAAPGHDVPPPASEDHSPVIEIPVSPPENRRAAVWTRRTPWAALDPARHRYAALSRRAHTRVDIAFGLLAPPVLGYVLYLPFAFLWPAVLGVWFWIILGSLLATALIIGVECARATRFPEPPARGEIADEDLPRLAVVVAAYLPNEADTILESLRAHLAVDYPQGRHLVVCSYNTPEHLPVEAELAELAASDPRFVPIRVLGSTSKVENVNAALDHLRGLVDVIGFFDADHHPEAGAPRRVARWLSDAAGPERFDVVQGQCQVRNVEDSFVTRTVAAEFATIYAVSHPGRTVFNDFGIFGGSNGWWRTETIEAIGMDADMLTEDIDASCRALEAGARLGTDPRIISTELAPSTFDALWRQRMRWSQGWWQVSLRHLRPLTTSPKLNGSQRRGAGLLFGWRVAHPWIATQMVPVVLAQLTPPDRPHVHWDLLLFMFTSTVVLTSPVIQAIVANRVAPPGLRGRRLLFARFALLSMVFYSELKATATRAAILRELLGAHDWEVTTRARPEKADSSDRHWHRRRVRGLGPLPAGPVGVPGVARATLEGGAR